MTPEEKQLLLKDLCGRLPYGVRVIQGDVIIENLNNICKVGDNDYNINSLFDDIYNGFSVDNVKPYLRPMSSMTEEEKEEIKSYLRSIEGQLIGDNGRHIWYFDYLNTHHFDYRGLIKKGLALEAPEGMYKT